MAMKLEEKEVEEKLSFESKNHIHLATENAKAAKILEACRWKDAETLRSLAASEGGLLSDELRRQAC